MWSERRWVVVHTFNERVLQGFFFFQTKLDRFIFSLLVNAYFNLIHYYYYCYQTTAIILYTFYLSVRRGI